MTFRRQSGARCLAALLALGWTVLCPPARSAEPMFYTVGLVAETDGQHWAYLHWRSTAFDLFAPRTWSVWRKDGTPSAPGPYTLESVVQVQRSAPALSGLLNRARHALGEDTTATRLALSELFQDLIPDTALSDAELASAVIQGVAAHPEFLESLQLVMRTFPSMAMALGTAHAVPIPPAGPVTFEIRQRASPSSPDEGVVGRVTIDATNPLILPAPSLVTVAPFDPDRPATSDLAIPLRWDMPADLRRFALAQHGFNVWRVEREFAEVSGWHTTPPAPGLLPSLSQVLGGPVGRVNGAPVLPSRSLDTAEAWAADHTVVFTTDHESRFPGYPETHVPARNGDQYYYFVTARDLLGRDGLVSPGVLGTFCSQLPPRVPNVLGVSNDYLYDGGPQHHLRVRWAANPPEENKQTTAYALYRWSSTGEMNQLGGDPLANLIAIVPHVPGETEFSHLDNGPGSPAAPADYTRTFWYTLRAIDDSGDAVACAAPPFNGNYSSHSPPVPGVLRDRFGPGAPTGGIRIRCAEPTADFERIPDNQHRPEGELSATAINVDLVVKRQNLDPNLAWVELSWGLASQEVFIGRFEFAPNQFEFVQRLTFPAAGQGAQVWVRARVATLAEQVAVSEQFFFNLPAPGPRVDVVIGVLAGVRYQTGAVDPTTGRRPCDTHTPVPPGVDGADDDGIEITFLPPPGMKQYKLYFRVDDGPLTLLREDSGEFDPATPIVNLWLSTPLYAGESCFFVQAFDQHGNPGPFVPLGCIGINFKFAPPAPVLAPIVPTGTEEAPRARIQWFAPRWGVARFQVALRGMPQLDPGAPEELTFLGTTLYNFKSYRSYLTPDVAAGFGSGALFHVEIPLPGDVEIEVAVRSLTVTGGQTKWSNFEPFEWTAPEVYLGPDVPWPPRPLPSTRPVGEFNSRVLAKAHPEGGGMVRVGEIVGRITHDPRTPRFLLTAANDPLEQVYVSTGVGTPRRLFPFVLYRVQVPGAEWPQVSGDVTQVSPLMQSIAWTPEGIGSTIYDPFIHIEPPQGASATPTDPGYMYVLDTQPALSRAIYRYFLVLLDPVTGEIEEILVTNDAQL